MAIIGNFQFGTSNRKPSPTVNCEMDERRKKLYSSSKPWKKIISQLLKTQMAINGNEPTVNAIRHVTCAFYEMIPLMFD